MVTSLAPLVGLWMVMLLPTMLVDSRFPVTVIAWPGTVTGPLSSVLNVPVVAKPGRIVPLIVCVGIVPLMTWPGTTAGPLLTLDPIPVRTREPLDRMDNTTL